MLHSDWFDPLLRLQDDELGSIVRFFILYWVNEREPPKDIIAKGLEFYVDFIKPQILRDMERMSEISKFRSEIGKKGGQNKKGFRKKQLLFSDLTKTEENVIKIAEKEKEKEIVKEKEGNNKVPLLLNEVFLIVDELYNEGKFNVIFEEKNNSTIIMLLNKWKARYIEVKPNLYNKDQIINYIGNWYHKYKSNGLQTNKDDKIKAIKRAAGISD